MHVNHCVVDCLTCRLATQNQEFHREVQSAWCSWSTGMVYIPIQQRLLGLHVIVGGIPYLPGTKIANGPKCTT